MRLVTSIVLHLTTLSSASVMECLHGKAASYNLLEGIYANAVPQEVDFVWNPVMVVKSVILVKGNMKMYGLRVNAKRMVWSEFAEAMRVLKLEVDRDVFEHLQQLEKYPDTTFVDSLLGEHQNTENHELQCIMNYLFHCRLADPFFLAHRVTFIL